MYFSNCNTVDEIKARFKELARKHHPDLGGDTETMKQINLRNAITAIGLCNAI